MSEKLLRHVVLFGFKDTTTSQQIQEVEQVFAALPSKIDIIHDFEWGTDVSVENLAQGYSHCFLVTFRSEAHRDTYLPHPAHQKLTGLVGPLLERVLVVDYWTG
jgi:hypothetical protein